MTPPPRVSVVLPCRNEERHIETCLTTLLRQQEPRGGMEILVADGRSDDRTRETIRDFASRDPRVRLVDNPQRTTPCGLNAAIRAARGEVIVRVDGHTEYASDYIWQSVAQLEATNADNVGGAARTRAEGPWQRANAAAYHSPFSTGGGGFHRVDFEGETDTVPYGCWRKSRLLELGLFDERLVRNQDDELNLRIRLAGGRVWQSRSIRSWYRPRSSPARVFHQYFQYGYYKVLVIQKHRRPASLRHLIPIVFVLAVLLGPLVCAAIPSLTAVYLAGLGAYAFVNAIASMRSAHSHGWDLLPRLPVVFLAYHFGYGLGFLLGVVDFAVLRRGVRESMTAPSRLSERPADRTRDKAA